MNWAALIALLWQFFGPIIQKWLDGLFDKAKPEGAVSALDPPAGMARLFAAARAQTWWWQGGKRALLSACERVAVSRASEFWEVMRVGGHAPQMTASEARKIVDAM
jgi:hypothetical protein